MRHSQPLGGPQCAPPVLVGQTGPGQLPHRNKNTHAPRLVPNTSVPAAGGHCSPNAQELGEQSLRPPQRGVLVTHEKEQRVDRHYPRRTPKMLSERSWTQRALTENI